MIRFATRRPSVVWALSVMILLAGAVSFTKLPLATRTTVQLPKLSVGASWWGMSAEVIETYVTSPLESAVQGVRGVRRVDSSSRDGKAQLIVQLEPNADVQLTRLAILERMELLGSQFPVGVTNKYVSNYVPEGLSEQPLMSLSISGPFTPGTLQKVLSDRVKPQLSAVQGVSAVFMRGGADPGVAVTYDATMLRRMGLSPARLSEAVSSARIVQTLGVERRFNSSTPVVLRDQPQSLDDVLRLPITGPGAHVYHVGELANVRAEEDSRGSFYRMNGRTAVTIEVMRQATADAIQTAAALRGVVAQVQWQLPAGVQLSVASDESIDLSRDLQDLARRGAISFIAVLVVLSALLQRWRSVALVMGSTAVAIAGTALTLFLFHVPANLLTLAGLGMGVGILVQNAIIVVNRLSSVPDQPDARAAAATRIMPAVVGSTLTTAVVLFPFLYLQGDARAAFVPFASAFVIATVWSVFTALIVVPSLGAGISQQKVQWKRTASCYRWMLQRCLRFRWLTLLVAAATLGIVAWGFVKKVPRYSWGGYGEYRSVLSVSLGFPRGSDPEAVDRSMREFEAIALGRPEVELVKTVGSNGTSANMSVMFTRAGGLTSVPLELKELLTQRAVLIGGASVSVVGEGPGFSSGYGGGFSSSFRIKVMGYSYDGVSHLASDLQERLEHIPRVRDVRITAGGYGGGDRGFEVTLEPDRSAMATLGVTASDFARAVQREVQGRLGSTPLEIGGEELPVSVKSAGARERTLEQLQNAIIPTVSGSPVRIGDLSVVNEREALSVITREDQQYVRTVSYDFRGPPKLAQRTNDTFMKNIAVPPGYSAVDANANYNFGADDSEKGLYLVFALGVTLVVLVVALVFDSVWGSWMVFLSLPLALAGVGAAFWMFDSAFTREAAVGVILVVGLAVHQSILLVDAALHKRRARLLQGQSPALDAGQVMQAATDRVSMIVLVTLTSLASLAPLSIGTQSNNLFGAIALATAGGTVAGTVAAMFIIPTLLVGRRGPRPPGRRRFRGPVSRGDDVRYRSAFPTTNP